MDSKFLRLLGLAARAGKIVSGQDGVRIAVAKGKAHLLIVDAQSAPDSIKKAQALGRNANLPLVCVDADIGRLTGREGRKIAAVTDSGFAQALASAHNQQE